MKKIVSFALALLLVCSTLFSFAVAVNCDTSSRGYAVYCWVWGFFFGDYLTVENSATCAAGHGVNVNSQYIIHYKDGEVIPYSTVDKHHEFALPKDGDWAEASFRAWCSNYFEFPAGTSMDSW